MGTWGKIILHSFILLVLQIVIVNNWYMGGYINPFPYIMIILMVNTKFPNWALLITAFLVGFIMDMFAGILGMHAAACVLMAFFKPVVLRVVALPNNFDEKSIINMRMFGSKGFLLYTLILTLLHHITYFLIETFDIHELFITLLRIVLSTIVTMLFIIIFQFFFYSKEKNPRDR